MGVHGHSGFDDDDDRNPCAEVDVGDGGVDLETRRKLVNSFEKGNEHLKELAREARDKTRRLQDNVRQMQKAAIRRKRAIKVLRQKLDESEFDRESTERAVISMGDKLRQIVNSIRGEPTPDTRHSTHDAPELVEGLVARLQVAEKLIADLARNGLPPRE